MPRRLSIRAAARPFVARVLRGPRGRRLLALSVLLTAMSGVLGVSASCGRRLRSRTTATARSRPASS